MRALRRWNWKKRKYEIYKVPIDRDITTFRENMDDLIDCASCGKRIIYGESYTSMEIHTDMGFGYSVCKDCHDKELKGRYANDYYYMSEEEW